MVLRYHQLQHVFERCLSALTQPTIVLSLVCCPVDDTLFKVGLKIHCSGVKSPLLVIETIELVLSQLKNFL